MPILSITTNVTGLVGVFPRIVYIETNDLLTTVLTTGYLNKAVENGFVFQNGDMGLVSTMSSPTAAPLSTFLEVVHAGASWSLVAPVGSGGVNAASMNDLAYYATNGNVVSGLTTANSSALVTTSVGAPTWIGPMTNGKLAIGSTGATPVSANLTAGTGIQITNGPGSISISVTGDFQWVNQTSSTVSMSVETGYTVNNGASLVTLLLPSTSTYGDYVEVNGFSAGGWLISQASGQSIRIGNQTTTIGVGGSLASSNRYDCVRLRCIDPNTEWTVVSQQSSGLTFV